MQGENHPKMPSQDKKNISPATLNFPRARRRRGILHSVSIHPSIHPLEKWVIKQKRCAKSQSLSHVLNPQTNSNIQTLMTTNSNPLPTNCQHRKQLLTPYNEDPSSWKSHFHHQEPIRVLNWNNPESLRTAIPYTTKRIEAGDGTSRVATVGPQRSHCKQPTTWS
jgi:hypothetical protein